MKRKWTIAAFWIVLCLGEFSLVASKAAAEPIPGSDDLAIQSEAKPGSADAAAAMELFKAGDYDSALSKLKQAVKNDADLPPAGVILAQLHLQADRKNEANAALEQSIAEEPGDPEAYLLLARLALMQRDHAKAESLCQKCGELLDSFEKSAKRKKAMQPWLFDASASISEARGDWSAAQRALESWLKLEPKNPIVIRRIAHCLFKQNDAEGALKKLRESVGDSAPGAPEAELALFYQQAGDPKNAGKWMDAAVDAAPKNLGIRLFAGQWALDAGRLDAARDHAKAAMRIAPNSAEARFFRGMVALLEQEYIAAEPFLESALKQSPDNFPFANNLVLALIGQDDEAKQRRALEMAESNLERNPRSADAAVTHAWVFYKIGRLDDAEKALRGASSIVNSDIDAAYVAARVAVDRGRKAEARSMLENALKTPKSFVFRQDAEALLEQLKK